MTDDLVTGRRITEIEITPEMIEAGVRPFRRHDPEFGPYTEGVERVIEAVLERGGIKVIRT